MTWANQYRRNETAQRAILAAALEVCRDVGYEATRIEAIARQAGVGKQTIYRWWPSKGMVLLEALNDAVGRTTDFPDTGDILADLRTQMHGVVALFTSPDLSPILRALIAGAQSDKLLSDKLVNELIGPRRAGFRARLQLAVDRGELKPGTDIDRTMELLYSPLYYRLLITGQAISVSYVDDHLAEILPVAK